MSDDIILDDLVTDDFVKGLKGSSVWLRTSDMVQVVRCADCKYCFDWSSDPMEPYDGESEWYCERWDKETSAYGTDPYRFYCADGERRNDDGNDNDPA